MERIYSYTVECRIEQIGKDGQETRIAFLAETTPEAAISEAQRVLAVQPHPDARVTWVVVKAEENLPDLAAQWTKWHRAPVGTNGHGH